MPIKFAVLCRSFPLGNSIEEVMMTRAAFLLTAAAAGVFAMSAVALAQDITPAQGTAAQQSAQGGVPATNDASYGGSMSTTKASGASRDAWTSTSQLCMPGLSCNIYQGQ